MLSLSPRSDVPAGRRTLPRENQYGHTKKLRFLIDEIAAHRARIGRPVTILDFGCGNGSAVSQYLMGDGIHYYGVDIHAPSLDYARTHFGGPAALFYERVPPDVQFDVIVYADVLEHVHSPRDLLRTHSRQLAADGIVIGAVPNGYGPFEIEQRLDRWLRLSRILTLLSKLGRRARTERPPAAEAALPYNAESGHVVFFTRRSLALTIAEGGFEIVRFAHGAFMGASVSGIALGRSSRLLRWNVRIADRLPGWAVSTWYFTLRPRGDGAWSTR